MSEVILDLTNESVQVKIHEKPECRIEMEVHAPSDMVKIARRKAIKAVGKEIVLPGFRKGKAPDETVLKKYPRDVEKQQQKELADLAFAAAQKVKPVPLLNNNASVSFEMKKISEEGADLIFSFETEPKIPDADFAGFQKRAVDRPEVADKQLEEAVRQMRFFYAQWEPVSDRAIEDGDYIMIDLDTIEGEEIQRVFHHVRFEVSKGRMANWMKKLVEGAKTGDVLEGISTPDETASETEKAEFKPKKVRLTILKVEKALLPELDDEFAKKVGASDVAHMRQSILNMLNKQADEKVLSEEREQINDYLVENYTFELPKSLIEAECKHRLTQLAGEPSFKTKWNKMSEEERKALYNKLSLESAQAVRLFYLSRAIVQKEKIPVTHQEVQQEAAHIYQTHGGKSGDQMPKEVFALALSKVILAKAQDHALKKA